MSQTFTLDDAEKEYSNKDWGRENLKVDQIYRWRALAQKTALSKAGNKMVVIEVAPVVEGGKILKQFSKKVYVTIPVKTLQGKAYSAALQRYFGTLQAFAAPKFNAFSKIEKTESGTNYFDKDGNLLDRVGVQAAIDATKAQMMEHREAFLNGELTVVDADAYALLKSPKGDNEWPEIGFFMQDVSPESKYPVAETFAEMVG